MSKNLFPTTTPTWRAAVLRRRRWYALGSAALALGFGFLSYRIYALEQPHRVGPQTSAVFSGQEIPAGTRLTEEVLETRRVPESFLPAAYYQGIEHLVGEETLHDLVAGQIITPVDLLLGSGGPTAARCPVRFRCVSVPFDWFMADPPELYPGDWVDLAAVHPGLPEKELGFLAADVQVVAVLDQAEKRALILALGDQEALALSFARAQNYQFFLLVQSLKGQ